MRSRRLPAELSHRAPARPPPFLLAALVLVACAPSKPAGVSEPPGVTAPAATYPPVQTVAAQGAWKRIAPPPIPPAGGMATAWTGHQLVVWSGGAGGGGNWQPSDAGAAYDPAADRWAVLPPAPVQGRIGATAVWTGREVLFWGGQAGPQTIFADGAAYDPATRRWRALPAAPIGGRSEHQAVWTGREMVVWGGYSRCCPTDSVIHDSAAAAYDPATDGWRRIASVPPPWSGDDGSAVTVADGDRPMIWRQGRLAAYDPAADRWVDIPGALSPPEPTPGQPTSPSTTGDPFAVGVATGGDVFSWTGGPTGRLDGLAYRPAPGVWHRVAALDGQSGAAVTAGGPGTIYAAAGQSARVLEYRIGDDQWAELPLAPIPTRSAATLVWTGSDLLFWGGIGDEGPEMDGATWHCC